MAVDATGVPTSPDNLPKLNTSVDAPSGLGMNAMMDSVQTALNTKPGTPAGLLSGEAMVWNGAAFVRNSVTPVANLGAFSAVASAGANQDLAWPSAQTHTTFFDLTGSGATIRSVVAPTAGLGNRILFRNSSAGVITLRHNATAGATGVILFTRSATDILLNPSDTAEFVYATSNVWVEVSRDKITPSMKIRAPDFSCPNTTVTPITGWNATDWGQGGMVSGSGGITVPEAGIYAVTFNSTWTGNPTGYRDYYITVAGVTRVYIGALLASSYFSNAPNHPVVGQVQASAGEQIGIQVSQNSGGALVISVGVNPYQGLAVTKVA